MITLKRLSVVLSMMLALGCESSGTQAEIPGKTTPQPDCADGAKNGTETDIDCGGSCGACADGKSCATGNDCKGGQCVNGVCGKLPQVCTDGQVDGDESDVDCGGKVCPACADGKKCAAATDCKSLVCAGGVCKAASCTDKVKNGTESDVDCGGTCPKCDMGKACNTTADCAAGACVNGKCAPATCADGLKNGDESDLDCGGACVACADGKKCNGAADCKSGSCSNGVCQAASCTDKVKNGTETDVDCGGTCPKCALGKSCSTTADCAAGACVSGKCAPATCADGLKNGDESDLDCGGACVACADGKKCGKAADCKSLVCTGGTCQAPSCTDKVKNGDESDLDCGGACPTKCTTGQTCQATSDCAAVACVSGKCAAASCVDGLKNGDESDVDCGGTCPDCADGKTCAADTDCVSIHCVSQACVAATCQDSIKNQDETDADCGGATCPKCDVGKSCKGGADCASALCFNNACVPPGCGDFVKNGDETDVDCGGSKCPPCAAAKKCLANTDCQDGVCTNGTCAPPSCSDTIKNGAETDVDCGGPTCAVCGTNLGCKKGTDCASGICVNSQCQIPSCKDGVKNGTETDIDCGGACPACGPTKGCSAPKDCWDNICDTGHCGSSNTVTVGGTGNPPLDPKGDGSKLVVLDPNGNVTVDRQTALLAIARYLYVSNSGGGTVSKIDPTTFKEVARYCTAPGCNADPSRASVSLDGNVGVANRANYFYSGAAHPERASAVVIAGDTSRCVDRNHNGVIDTSTSTTAIAWPANTTISPDECVLWWTSLTRDRNGAVVGGAGTLPRSATFDSKSAADGSLSSNFYVGLYGTSELVQLDAATGGIKQQVAVGGQPYSSVFDRFSNLWIRDAASNRLIKVDTKQASLPATFVGPSIPCGYAITADSRGNVYGAGGNCVSRIDPSAATPAWETVTLPGACFPRGPSLDAAFNLWVPDTCGTGYHVDASKPVGQGMTVKKSFALPPASSNYLLGTAIDGNGMPYFVNTETSNLQQVGGPNGTVYRVDPANNYAVSSIRVGASPYVYSDLSGSQLALTAPTTGSFRKNFPAYCGDKAVWDKLSWTETVPAGTTLQVRYRAAKDVASLATAPFVTVGTEPPTISQPVTIALPQGTDPSVLQVEFVIATSDTANKPTLGSVTVSYACP